MVFGAQGQLERSDVEEGAGIPPKRRRRRLLGLRRPRRSRLQSSTTHAG